MSRTPSQMSEEESLIPSAVRAQSSLCAGKQGDATLKQFAVTLFLISKFKSIKINPFGYNRTG